MLTITATSESPYTVEVPALRDKPFRLAVVGLEGCRQGRGWFYLWRFATTARATLSMVFRDFRHGQELSPLVRASVSFRLRCMSAISSCGTDKSFGADSLRTTMPRIREIGRVTPRIRSD